MSHDTTIRNVYGITLATVVRRIVRTFDRATAADIESGARWYDEAGELATHLSSRSDRVATRDHAACLIAALSPRTSWSRNVAGALDMADGQIPDYCIGTNVDRALGVLDADDPYSAMGNGPKVANFARNIAGDREAVTVDVWACRVVDIDELKLGRKGAYDAIAHAYRLAARRRGVDPATMQATTWVVARNGRAS